jgi:hypothetical protein
MTFLLSLGFIDTCIERGSSRKMFNSKLVAKPKTVERLQKLSIRLNGVLVDLKLNKVGGKVAPQSCLLYDALIYKFGLSNRHQKVGFCLILSVLHLFYNWFNVFNLFNSVLEIDSADLQPAKAREQAEFGGAVREICQGSLHFTCV